MKKTVVIDGKDVELTNLTKMFWPDDNITKADFIDYHAKVAPYILPHLKGRPLVFTRYPDGIHGKSFYQKNIPEYAPDWLNTYESLSDDVKIIRYMLIDDTASLIWAANQASLEFHPWLSTIDSPEYPDFAVFDFDPMEKTDFEDARRLALALRNLLELQGISGYPKTSGATGLQVYVPIEPIYTYEQVRNFVKVFCRALEETFPSMATTERNIKKRQGKIYLDYLQNIKGKTIIAPYSTRPRKGAPVSCPVSWEELEQGANPSMFHLRNMPKRLEQKGDLFRNALLLKQNIDRWIG